MENSSKRHHYIPQFYLKGFANKGHFMIYLPKERRFKKNGKLFSVETHFFKENDNTFFNEIGSSDFLEKAYRDTETEVSKIFDKIHMGVRLDEQDVPYLQYFVSVLYWRLPTNLQIVEYLAEKNTLKAFNIRLKSSVTNEFVEDFEIEEQIKANPNYNKFIRAILPIVTYKDLFECKSDINIIDLPVGFPAICSDNPLIMRNQKSFDIYRDDFILPISNTKVLVRIKNLKWPIHNYFRLDLDCVILAQAKDYVCCLDKGYPFILTNFFEKHGGDIDVFRDRLFRWFEADWTKESPDDFT